MVLWCSQTESGEIEIRKCKGLTCIISKINLFVFHICSNNEIFKDKKEFVRTTVMFLKDVLVLCVVTTGRTHGKKHKHSLYKGRRIQCLERTQ